MAAATIDWNSSPIAMFGLPTPERAMRKMPAAALTRPDMA
jgi:hypothetical protein